MMINFSDISVADSVEPKRMQRGLSEGSPLGVQGMAIAFRCVKQAVEAFSFSHMTYHAIAFLLQGSNLLQCSWLLRHIRL